MRDERNKIGGHADLFRHFWYPTSLRGILLLVLAVLLYKLNLENKGKVTAGITGIYVVSAFAGGFLIGKLQKVRKFIWGLILGMLYFLLLVLVSVGVYHTLQGDTMQIVTTLILCAAGGMLGGMLS